MNFLIRRITMNNTKSFDMAKAAAELNASGSPFGCVSTSLPDPPVPAMAYVPFQLDRTAFSPEQALMRGTLFTVLDKPFKGKGCM